MRLADADVLPYRFTNLADATHDYLKEVQELLKQKQEQVKEQNRELQDGVFAVTNDPRRPKVSPKPEVVPPYINFAPLQNAAGALHRILAEDGVGHPGEHRAEGLQAG
jgi:N-acetylated-alpha-linked acidic dipeptidase